MRSKERGQVLPLFALFLVILFAMSALAIDVTSAYSALQGYRTTTDAAALAGAQDLQATGTRTVTAADRIRARTDAIASVFRGLGATGPGTCDPAPVDVNVVNCTVPGTSFLVSVKTPSPTCVRCDSTHAVQVTLDNPSFQVSFSHLFGVDRWNVGRTSVAGLTFARAYAVETLRPPKKSGSTFLVNDIEIDGGSVVNVTQGDVGSNANMNYSGLGSILNIDPGYGMYYFDPFSGPGWTGPPSPPIQIVQKLPTLIEDPNYTYPAMAGILGTSPCAGAGTNCAPTFTDARESSCTTAGANPACSRADLDPACLTEAGKLDPTRYTFMTAQLTDPSTIYCYNAGIYDTNNPGQLSIGTANLGILLPGAYYFKGGLAVAGRVVGGYEPSKPGVALMFDECLNQCTFNGNNALTIALNAGTKMPPGSSGVGATAAHDWNDQLVLTSGPSSPNPPILMTLLVTKDPTCYVPTSPPYQEPMGCDSLKDKTLNLAGGGSLALEGVQYAPTDNVEIHGGSSGTGTIGQIISWTLFYSGGTRINQEGAGSESAGILRLDAACTVPGTPCNP